VPERSNGAVWNLLRRRPMPYVALSIWRAIIGWVPTEIWGTSYVENLLAAAENERAVDLNLPAARALKG
jgi:hypothetical protein